MNIKFKNLKIKDLPIELIDGDRGKNYPKNDEITEKGYCLFLNAKNVTSLGFDFSEKLYITKEKDEILRKGKLKRKDIVLTTRGTVGNVAYYSNRILDENIRINSGMLILRNISEFLNEQYVYWFLRSKIFQNAILMQKTGSAQPQLPISILKEMEITICEKDYQDKIVKVLNLLQEKIDLNNQTNDNLYNMCNAIFHNYIDKYSEQLEYIKIVDIADRVVTGKTPSTKNDEFWNGDIPFITIPDMHNQVFTIDTERTISDVGAKSIIPENSISVSCIATVGLVSISTKKSQTNQQINSIVLKNDYDLYYLFEFLSEQESFMKNIAGGSTTYNINKTTFENIEVPYLPQNLVQEFHNIVCKLFDKIKLNQLENKNLEQLRDTLLPKLMNGEIDLEKIEN